MRDDGDKTMEGCAPEIRDQFESMILADRRHALARVKALEKVLRDLIDAGGSLSRESWDSFAEYTENAGKVLRGEALPNPPDQPGSLQIEKQLNAPSAQGGK